MLCVFPGTENADEPGVEDADGVEQEHSAVGEFGGVFFGEVSSWVGKVPVNRCACPRRR
jgi:hypothetical protein